jgi:diguanylate cyclase (GGDEF)-like protein
MYAERDLFRPHSREWAVLALATIVAVGAVDYLTGPEITFSVFYLVPVAAAAWRSGTKAAVVASVLAAIVWFSAEYASSRVDVNSFVYFWNFCARLLFLLLVALLLARLRDMLDRERDLSRTDSLTGLYNARRCREIVEDELARAQRYGHPLSLAFIDVDDFKRVNDTGGHSAGDRLLRSIARTIRGNLRSSDIVARFGGDEFVLVLPFADQMAAHAVVTKLADKVAETMLQEDWPVTLSIGVVNCEAVGEKVAVDDVLRAADQLMYEVKAKGKGGVRFAPYGSLTASSPDGSPRSGPGGRSEERDFRPTR